MSKRLQILKNSLANKELELNSKIQNHFNTVKQANGQPLNDKRNGQATLKKWEKQRQSIRNLEDSIEKTKRAIDVEESKIATVENFNIPLFLQEAINDGLIVQWRKFPRFFFVKGVDKARIVLIDEKTGQIGHRYLASIKEREQFTIFKNVFNTLNAKSNEFQQTKGHKNELR